jgi:hypothetical protein
MNGLRGADGTSVTVDDVHPLVIKAVEAAVSALPPPKDGESVIGPRGYSAYEVAAAQGYGGTADEWARSLIGKDGDKGDPGQSITVDDVLPTVKSWFDALPPPAPGKDGKSITVDDIAEFMESHIAKWALDFERRAQDLLQRAIERIPAPKDGVNGKDGRDALDIDGFDATLEEDGRTVTLSLSRGETRIERKLSLPHVIYRGIYRQGETYQRGDSVTFGGSTWITNANTSGKPGEDSTDWRLAVKRGRDGKDGDPGKKGDPGRDLTRSPSTELRPRHD